MAKRHQLQVDLSGATPQYYLDGQRRDPKKISSPTVWWRVLVCGGREFDDSQLMMAVFDAINIHTLIHGGSRGADIMAAFIFGADFIDQDGEIIESGRVLRFLANWEEHGKAAGFIRNQRMLDEGSPGLVLAFPGGSGTEDMMSRAVRSGISVLQVSRLCR